MGCCCRFKRDGGNVSSSSGGGDIIIIISNSSSSSRSSSTNSGSSNSNRGSSRGSSSSNRVVLAAEREREMFYLTTHSTHFIYGYMASHIWLRTILIVRNETRCRHIGYSYRLAARVLLYAPSHRQDNTYHGLCYTSVEHWLEREIAQWVHPMKDRSDDPSHHERTLYL